MAQDVYEVKSKPVAFGSGTEIHESYEHTLSGTVFCIYAECAGELTKLIGYLSTLTKEQIQTLTANVFDVECPFPLTGTGVKINATVKIKRTKCMFEIHLTKPSLSQGDFEDIIARVRKQQLQELKCELKDYGVDETSREKAGYIPLLVSEHLNERESGREVLKELQDFFQSKNKVLVLWGDSGSGKSLTLKILAYQFWTTYQKGDPIPLWLPLEKVVNKSKILSGFFKRFCLQHGLGSVASVLQEQHWNIIIDSFDEISDQQNFYVKNGWKNWNVKVILGCRTQAVIGVIDKYEERYFAPTDGNRYQYNYLCQKFLLPFSEEQIVRFVNYFCINNRYGHTDTYLHAFKQFKGLDVLSKNPYMLQVLLEVVLDLSPQITQKLDRYAILEQYVTRHFERENVKLDERRINSTEMPSNFCEELAVKLFLEEYPAQYQSSINQLKYYPHDEESPWRDFFHGDKAQSVRISLLEEKSDKDALGSYYTYGFRHKCLLEHFVLKAILKEWQTSYVLVDELRLAGWDIKKLRDSLLNQRLINEEYDIRQGLADRLNNPNDQKRLLEILHTASAREDVSLVSANAMTILNQQGFVFSGLVLPNAKLAGADLTGGLFHRSELMNSDLRGAKLINGFLGEADLSGSKMKGIVVGQLPYLKEDGLISSVAYSPNGDYLAVVIRILRKERLSECKELHAFVEINMDEGGISFSDEERTHFARESVKSTVNLYSQEDFDIKKYLQLNSIQELTHIVFSPDSKLLAVWGLYHTAYVFNIETRRVFKLVGHIHHIKSVVWNHEGKLLATDSDDGTVRLWDINKANCIQVLEKQHHRYSFSRGQEDKSLVFGPDDTYLLFLNSGKVCRWELSTDNTMDIRIPLEKFDCIGSVVLSHNAEYLSILNHCKGAGKDIIYLLNMKMQEPLWELEVPKGAFQIALSSDNQYIAISYDNAVHLWYIKAKIYLTKLTGQIDASSRIAFSFDGKYLASACSDLVCFWKLEVFTEQSKWQGYSSRNTNAMFILQDRQLVFGTHEDGIVMWDTVTKLPSMLESHKESATALAYNPINQQLIVAYIDNRIEAWDLRVQKFLPEKIEGDFCGNIKIIICSPDGRRLAIGDWFKVHVWDIKEGRWLLSLEWNGCFNNYWENNLAFSPNGELLAIVSQEKLHVWHIEERKHLMEECGICPRFSSDGRWLAMAGSLTTTILLWDISTQMFLPKLGHSAYVKDLVFNPDNTVLVSGSEDGTVQFWAMETPVCLFAVGREYPWSIQSIVFSSNGEFLAFGDIGGIVQVWNAATYEYLDELQAHKGSVIKLHFSENGKYLLSEGEDKSVKLWQLQGDYTQLKITLYWTSYPMLFTDALNLSQATDLSLSNAILLDQMGANIEESMDVVERELAFSYKDWSFLLREERAQALKKKVRKSEPWIANYRQQTMFSCKKPQRYHGQISVVIKSPSQTMFVLEGIDAEYQEVCYCFYYNIQSSLAVMSIAKLALESLLKGTNIQSCLLTREQFNQVSEWLFSICQHSFKKPLDVEAWLSQYLKIHLGKTIPYDLLSIAHVPDYYPHSEAIYGAVEERYKIYCLGNKVRICQRSSKQVADYHLLWHMLMHCYDAVDMDVSYLNLDDHGVRLIGQWLECKEMTQVRVVRLSHNRITYNGLIELLTLLAQGREYANSLKYVFLDNNHIYLDEKFSEDVKMLFERSRLSNLDLSLNFILPDVVPRTISACGEKKAAKLEKYYHCKTLFRKNQQLLSFCFKGVASFIEPKYHIEDNKGVVGLFVYNGGLQINSDAEESAFLVMEGLYKFGQRYLMIANLCNNAAGIITIQFCYMSPIEFDSRIKELMIIHRRCTEIHKDKLNMLKARITTFREKQEMYFFSAHPQRDNEYNCLTWVRKILSDAQIVAYDSPDWFPERIFPSKYVNSTNCLMM